MKFRLFLVVIVLLNSFGCSSDVATTPPDEGDTPSSNTATNILLIIADDMGLDATPGYAIGSTKPTIPHIQEMMNSGVRFTNLWAYPTCTPTRSSILTGKYGFRTGVKKVDDALPTTETSLQKYINQGGANYSSAVIGKWHLSTDPTHPTQMGVEYYAGLLTGGVSSYTDWRFTQNGSTNSEQTYTTTKFTDLAISWVQQQQKPWFLWLAYNAPHTPFHLPEAHMHSQGSLPTDTASIDANPLPYYMAMIEAMDYEIGRLLDSMSAEERANTVIIFIGDNGTPNQVAQDYRARRVKGTVYQGGVNVPMVISGKNVTRVNEVETALLNTTDLFATIASLTGVNTTVVNDSHNFSGLLSSANSENPRTFSYTEIGKTTGSEDDNTIRNETHKYILFADGTEALYKLSTDPFENTNLLDSSLSTDDQQQLNWLKSTLNNLKQ